MTEQMPINQAATEQRLVEEIAGYTPPLEEHHAADLLEPGDPEPVEDSARNDHPSTD